MAHRDLHPEDERALARDGDRYPCNAILRLQDAWGMEAIFRC
jgi:hypothetical protein